MTDKSACALAILSCIRYAAVCTCTLALILNLPENMSTKPLCVRTLLSMERNASLEAGALGELALQVLSGLQCKQRTGHIKRQTLQDNLKSI